MPCRRDPYPCRTKGCPLEEGHSGECPSPKNLAKLKMEAAASPLISPQVLLCSACRVLERMDYDFEENPALSIWWAAHKLKDKKDRGK